MRLRIVIGINYDKKTKVHECIRRTGKIRKDTT